MKITPGSAYSNVACMIRFHRSRASIVRYTRPSNTKSQGASAFTASIKASVTNTLTLNIRNRAGSDLASMKSMISGWSQRIVAIIAPRRDPADMMVRHIESHTSMNDNGPLASAATPVTLAPLGRMVEKSYPMPPPCCIVRAASFSMSKIPPMLSGTVPMTKQLNKVTDRAVPAPAVIRPAGRYLKSSSAA